MKEYDIIVAGAGSAGICASLAAARAGKRVLLVEKNGFLGGTIVAAMVGPLMAFHAGSKQIVRGIAQEIIDRLAQRGGTLGHIPDPIGVASSITPIEATVLKQVYFEMLAEEKNIDVLLHTWLTGAQVQDRNIHSIGVVNKSGNAEISAKMFIDATGDADLAAFCHEKMNLGRTADELAQPMTLIFKLGNVDFAKVRAYIQAHPEQFVLDRNAMNMQYTAVSGYFDQVAKARSSGELNLNRDRVLLFQGVKPDEAIVNMTRVTHLSGVNAESLSRAEFEARAQMDEIIAFLKKRIDGFQDARLVESGDCIGIRESRHLEGRYKLTESDVMRNAEFDDSVAVCAYPIDIHDPTGAGLVWEQSGGVPCYDVPLRTMLPKRTSNLIVTGRCISATHEAAASVRITPTVMALGEAAGTAAALAVDQGCSTGQIDVAKLQAMLFSNGAVPGKKFIDRF